MSKDKPHFRYIKHGICWVCYVWSDLENRGVMYAVGRTLHECWTKYNRLTNGMCA